MLEFLKSNGRTQDRAVDADIHVPARGRPTTIALGAEAAERAIGPLVEAVAALTG